MYSEFIPHSPARREKYQQELFTLAGGDSPNLTTLSRLVRRSLPSTRKYFSFLLIPIYCLRTFPFSFSLPIRNSDPGSLLSRLFSPFSPLLDVPSFLSREERLQLFLPPSTRIELLCAVCFPGNPSLPLAAVGGPQ